MGTGSFTSIDGKETEYGFYGFQDMIAGVANYAVKGVSSSCRGVGWRVLS